MRLHIRISSFLLVSFFSLFMAGCDQIQDEFGTSEGFVGPLADGLLDARSQRQRADRYAMAMMMLVPVALETSGDAAETRATIQRANALYQSLAELYIAIGVCTPGAHSQPENQNTRVHSLTAGNCGHATQNRNTQVTETGYNFESLSYEVQSDLYFVGRTIVTNLDLDAEVSDLLSLEPTALLRIWDSIPQVFPAARRLAAGYRDGVVIFADAIASACWSAVGSRESNVPISAFEGDCGPLIRLLNQQFHSGPAENLTRRELVELLSRARSAAESVQWQLNPAQHRAFVAHLDRNCLAVFPNQYVAGGQDTFVNCGVRRNAVVEGVGNAAPTTTPVASEARDAYLVAVNLRPNSP